MLKSKINLTKEKIKQKFIDLLRPELYQLAGRMINEELKEELKEEIEVELNKSHQRNLIKLYQLPKKIDNFRIQVKKSKDSGNYNSKDIASELRVLVRSAAGLTTNVDNLLDARDLHVEFSFLRDFSDLLLPAFNIIKDRRILFCGQAYYNAWYLSRKLRDIGFQADLYNWDSNELNDLYYHGEDFRLGVDVPLSLEGQLGFYLNALYSYDVFHFSNAHGIAFGWGLQSAIKELFGDHEEIFLLKSLGKVIVYSNNGCLDGVSQTSFSKWGPENVCAVCRWQNEPNVCSDERNLAWGAFRNSVADYQCLLGGNRSDYNNDKRIHEVPEFYCLDPNLWHPEIEIPESYKLPKSPEGAVRLYHAVGNLDERTRTDKTNIKCTHIYLPLIERLQQDGLAIELINPTGIANKEVRFLQAQSDIFLEMLTFGWFGANAREAMMLGKPVICYIRSEWLESLRREIREYAEELPIVQATPQTVEGVLRDLIANPLKRREIGLRSREFAIKWHSDTAAAKRFSYIYSELLAGNQLLDHGVN